MLGILYACDATVPALTQLVNSLVNSLALDTGVPVWLADCHPACKAVGNVAVAVLVRGRSLDSAADYICFWHGGTLYTAGSYRFVF